MEATGTVSIDVSRADPLLTAFEVQEPNLICPSSHAIARICISLDC